MIKRRGFLGQTLACAAVAATTGLAGCSEPEGTEDVEAALELLDRNQELFDEFEALEDDELPDRAELDGIHQRISDAETHLDAADAVAEDDELREAIDLGYVLVSFQRSMTQALESMIDVLNGLDTVLAQFDAERYEDALETLGEAREHLSDANDAVSAAIEALEDVDEDVFEAQEQIEHRVGIGQLEGLDDELDIFEEQFEGFEEMMNGMLAFEASLDALEDEDFDEARRHAETARDEFEAVASRFEALENDPEFPAHMEADVVALRSDADSLHQGTGHYLDALDAAAREDWEAFDEHLEAMEEAFRSV